ncbi:MAG TPA: hypothetical protein PLE45_01475 [Spirochaetota bacterium]|nr:hypothetical protein [Spirochaetota bacterium]HOL57997.1 hypothetical protein [Spirochaetota bacterium]HPP03722.1 hypothetical protein [Spirochaetota bacterium]
MRNIFLLVIFTGLFNLYSFDIDVEKIFSQKDKEAVLKGEIITRRYMKYNPANLNTHSKIDVPKTEFTNEDYTGYEVIIDEKAFIPYEIKNESDLLKIFNIINNVSLAKGMKYYSNRAGEVLEFILESYMVEGENKFKKIDDPVYNKVQQKTEAYFYQKDNRFGKLFYKKTVYNEGNNFYIITECLDPIFFIVPLNKKGDYKVISYFIYNPENKGYFYYALLTTRIRNDFILQKGYTNATLFSSRLRAVTVHFAKLIGLDWYNKLKE